MTDEELMSYIPFRCITCGKVLDDDTPYIIAYKYKQSAPYCRDHIQDAEKYLDWYMEFVEIK